MGRSFIETVLEQKRGIAADHAIQAVEEQTADIGGGWQLANALDIALPALKRSGVGSPAAVGGAVIGGLNPGVQTTVEILHARHMLQIQTRQKLFPDAAEETFDFPAAFGLIGWRVDNQNT